jgi:myo-inositol 2-dehydrogenase / D-chiro-inositol 1-dehydrogenase
VSGAVRIGLVGLGRLGRRHAHNLLRRVDGAQLAAVCSTGTEDLAWAAAQVPQARRHASYEALLQDADVDAVFLVTPTDLHADQMIAALHSGRHVFCEKPLALNVPDCLRVQEAAALRPDLQTMIGFVRRFDPSYQDAYARTAAGEIGRPFLFRSQTADQDDPGGFFVRYAPKSGGIFLDMSVHDIDLARWFLGNPAPRRVHAAGTIVLHPGLAACGDVDNAVALCEFDGGALAVFTASRTQAHGHDTNSEIMGTRGKLVIGENPRADRVRIFDATGVRNTCVPTFYERFEEAFVREANAFVASIREQRPTGLTLHDATEATRIGLAITQALREGRIVELAAG